MTKKRCFECKTDKIFPDEFNAQGKICLVCHRDRERIRRSSDRDAYNAKMRTYRARTRDCSPKLRKRRKKIDLETRRKNKRLYYTTNVDRLRARNLKTKEARIKLIREIKQSRVCARCGFADFRCLTFHHLKDKEFEISEAPSMKISVARLMKEIAKCIVLCANCHMIEHFTE